MEDSMQITMNIRDMDKEFEVEVLEDMANENGMILEIEGWNVTFSKYRNGLDECIQSYAYKVVRGQRYNYGCRFGTKQGLGDAKAHMRKVLPRQNKKVDEDQQNYN